MRRSTLINAPTATTRDDDCFQQLDDCIDEWGFKDLDFDVRLLAPFNPSCFSLLRAHLPEYIRYLHLQDKEIRSALCLLYDDSKNDRNEPVPDSVEGPAVPVRDEEGTVEMSEENDKVCGC